MSNKCLKSVKKCQKEFKKVSKSAKECQKGVKKCLKSVKKVSKRCQKGVKKCQKVSKSVKQCQKRVQGNSKYNLNTFQIVAFEMQPKKVRKMLKISQLKGLCVSNLFWSYVVHNLIYISLGCREAKSNQPICHTFLLFPRGFHM